MQTVVQVVCKPGTSSLREAIGNDKRLDDSGFVVVTEKKPGRSQGWLKLHSTVENRRGAINIVWLEESSVLMCRVVNRKRGRPALITGDLVYYLLARHSKRIQSISVIPR